MLYPVLRLGRGIGVGQDIRVLHLLDVVSILVKQLTPV